MKSPLGIGAVSFALFLAQAGAAVVVQYSDRDQFVSLSGTLELQNFNAFTNTTYFNNSPLVVGDLTLSVAPVFPVFEDPFNSIQVAPANTPGWAVDGTNIVRIGLSEVKTFTIQFAEPVYSFGSYFGAWNDGQVRAQLEILSSTFIAPVTAAPEVRFFGYISDTPFSSITIRGLGNEGLYLDNVVYSTQVPEPAQGALLAVGILGFLGRRRRVGRRAGDRA